MGRANGKEIIKSIKKHSPPTNPNLIIWDINFFINPPSLEDAQKKVEDLTNEVKAVIEA